MRPYQNFPAACRKTLWRSEVARLAEQCGAFKTQGGHSVVVLPQAKESQPFQADELATARRLAGFGWLLRLEARVSRGDGGGG